MKKSHKYKKNMYIKYHAGPMSLKRKNVRKNAVDVGMVNFEQKWIDNAETANISILVTFRLDTFCGHSETLHLP